MVCPRRPRSGTLPQPRPTDGGGRIGGSRGRPANRHSERGPMISRSDQAATAGGVPGHGWVADGPRHSWAPGYRSPTGRRGSLRSLAGHQEPGAVGQGSTDGQPKSCARTWEWEAGRPRRSNGKGDDLVGGRAGPRPTEATVRTGSQGTPGPPLHCQQMRFSVRGAGYPRGRPLTPSHSPGTSNTSVTAAPSGAQVRNSAGRFMTVSLACRRGLNPDCAVHTWRTLARGSGSGVTVGATLCVITKVEVDDEERCRAGRRQCRAGTVAGPSRLDTRKPK